MKRIALFVSLALLAGTASQAGATARLVELRVFDRTDEQILAVHRHRGQAWVVGVSGHEYRLRIRNRSGERVLAVVSVDGVNVVTGETADPAQTGYVIDPYGSVEISGWRKSLAQTAAFHFTRHANAYATRTGRGADVGVIGVAVFRERAAPPQPIARREAPVAHEAADAASTTARAAEGAAAPEVRARVDDTSAAQASTESTHRTDEPAAASAAEAHASAGARARRDATNESHHKAQAEARLGTGHGRRETSVARYVSFERATGAPAEVVSLRYDSRRNLVALGVIRAPVPCALRPQPRPFPGFVPDPGAPAAVSGCS